MIDLITTMNQPCLHFELNEAWILAPEAATPGDAVLMELCGKMAAQRELREEFPEQDSHPRTGGVANDGRFLVRKRAWFYNDGKKQYEAAYQLGRGGKETHWRTDGTKEWQWEHNQDGISVWTQFWPNGRKKAESHWRGRFADGLATCWNPSGKEVSRAVHRRPGESGSGPRRAVTTGLEQVRTGWGQRRFGLLRRSRISDRVTAARIGGR